MKMRTLLYATLLLPAVTITSCSGGAENNAKSINVDSSNLNGTAPVQYGPNDPKDTTHSLETSDDTGRRANTSNQADSMGL